MVWCLEFQLKEFKLTAKQWRWKWGFVGTLDRNEVSPDWPKPKPELPIFLITQVASKSWGFADYMQVKPATGRWCTKNHRKESIGHRSQVPFCSGSHEEPTFWCKRKHQKPQECEKHLFKSLAQLSAPSNSRQTSCCNDVHSCFGAAPVLPWLSVIVLARIHHQHQLDQISSKIWVVMDLLWWNGAAPNAPGRISVSSLNPLRTWLPTKEDKVSVPGSPRAVL